MILLGVVTAFVYGFVELFIQAELGEMSVIIFLVAVAGTSLGNKWWQYIYVERRYTNTFFDRMLDKK